MFCENKSSIMIYLLSRYVTLNRLLMVSVLSVAAATVAAFFAKSGWLSELFTHFPLQYLMIAAACGAALAWRGHRRMALLAGSVVAVNLTVLLAPRPIGHRAEASVAEGQGLSLLLTNVQRVNTRHHPIIQYIEAEKPDIVAVLEMDGEWRRDLDAGLAAYPHRLIREQENNFGIGVYSRVPLIAAEVLDLSGAGVASLLFRVRVGGKSVRILATHPVPPTSQEQAGIRDRQLAAIAAMATRGSTPMIVIGDLNLTPWSPRFQALLDQGALADSRVGFGHHATWPTWFPLLWIPIDHVLVGRGIEVYRRDIGPAVGSDHYPVLVEVGIQPSMAPVFHQR